LESSYGVFSAAIEAVFMSPLSAHIIQCIIIITDGLPATFYVDYSTNAGSSHRHSTRCLQNHKSRQQAAAAATIFAFVDIRPIGRSYNFSSRILTTRKGSIGHKTTHGGVGGASVKSSCDLSEERLRHLPKKVRSHCGSEVALAFVIVST
jgi:hypothetical protein